MAPKTDLRALRCVNLIRGGDGSRDSLTKFIKKCGLPDDDSTRRNIRRHLGKQLEEALG